MIAATIVARNYLAQAQVLATSFLLRHPDARFVTLVVDGDDQDRSEPGVGSVVLPEDLRLSRPEWEQMVAIYSVMELSTAVKPALLRWLLRARPHGSTGAVLYLDPDIEVYHPFPEVFVAATRTGIVLTPHVLHSLPRDDREPTEQGLMLAGLFNLGFICVSRRALDFLDWWHHRLAIDAVVDVANGLFTDQRWVDWVPSLFGAHVERDHGLNVAYWNVHERPLSRRADGALMAGGDLLKFFHFSGFDPERPWQLSKHATFRPRCHLSEHPLVAELCGQYATALLAAGFRERRKAGYGFDRTATGLQLTALVRSAYRTAVKRASTTTDDAPPGPFAADGGAAFARWLVEPVWGPTNARFDRWEYGLWHARPDLRAAFPDVLGGHAPHYRHWLDHDQPSKDLRAAGGLPPPDEVARGQPLLPPVTLQPPADARDDYGWNIVGYHAAQLGVGEAGRRMRLAFAGAGLPTDLVGVSAPGSREDHRTRHVVRSEVVHRRSLYCVNADQLASAVQATDPADRSAGRDRGGRRIGLWFWELEQFPTRWYPMFDLVDEVWCASEFTADALRAAATVPVFVVPLAVVPPARPTPYTRAQLGLPDAFVFLCTFDFHSVFGRKNPLGTLEAYRRAFGPYDGAALVLKSINGHHHHEIQLDQLRQAAADRPDVTIVDGYLDEVRVQGLMERADCLVSLHRSEGFGLNLAAAMASGTPVVATGYSGNLAFMDADSALLVPHRLVPVGPGQDPYDPDAVWAEPDLDVAAAYMRQLFDDRAEAAALGTRGREAVLRRSGLDVASSAVGTLILGGEPWWDEVEPEGRRKGRASSLVGPSGDREGAW